MKETGLDPSRIVFLGSLDHASLIRLFQVSAVHVYLTVPFVLSWSVMEAMACGCLVVGSRTAPVEEVIADRRNGVLVDFWNDELVEAVMGAIDKPDLHRPLRSCRAGDDRAKLPPRRLPAAAGRHHFGRRKPIRRRDVRAGELIGRQAPARRSTTEQMDTSVR